MNQCLTGTGWYRRHYPGPEVQKSALLLGMELVVSLLMLGLVAAAGSFELVDEALQLKLQLEELG
jgi:hypothetical protein